MKKLSLYDSGSYPLTTLNNDSDLIELVHKPAKSSRDDDQLNGKPEVNVWVENAEDHGDYKNWRISLSDAFDRVLGGIGFFIVTLGYILSSHNLFKSRGRKQIKHSILRSGPAYQIPGSQGKSGNGERRFSGWRMGALLNIGLLALCLIAEITMISVAFSMDSKVSAAYDGVLYKGNCAVAKRWTSILSLALNLIATLLIGSSNYMMQCFTAPTAADLRQEHTRGKSVHLGVMSTRKPLIWWIMGLTSVPVHLLFNSSFFSSLQTNDYAIAIVSADYATLGTSENCTKIANTTSSATSWASLACGMVVESSSWDRLDVQDCVKRYSSPFISEYSNVILVSNVNSSERTGRYAYTSPYDQTDNILEFISNYTYNFSDHNVFTDHNASLNAQIWDYPGFLGIFSAFAYKEWRDSYNHRFNISNTTSSLTDIPSWMCNSNFTQACTQAAALQHSSNWLLTPAAIRIDQCLSQPTPGENCEVQYSSTILLIVIGCDVLKILIVSLALFSTKEPLCVTIGDAVSNFVRHPEECTAMRCFADRETVEYEHSRANLLSQVRKNYNATATPDVNMAYALPTLFERQPMKWKVPRKRRWNAPSRWQWWAVLQMFVPILIATCILIGVGAYTIQRRGAGQIWTRGFLSVDQNAIFPWTQFDGHDSGDSAFLRQVLVINTPQLMFSFLYYVFNGIFTTMHAAKEWAGFATKRKPLRVTDPEPGQRSTYWLSLPWSNSLPLLLVSGLLHWLLSRSLYLVRVNVIGPDGQEAPDERISACGFSILMMLFKVILLCSLASFTFWFGYQKLDAAIPLVGAESAAISAACHHPNDAETEATKPLLWGVVEKPENGKPGHCSFSSGYVEPPMEGEYYW